MSMKLKDLTLGILIFAVICPLMTLSLNSDTQLGSSPQIASPSALAHSTAQFALSLYNVLKDEVAPTENIFFSPFSISTALSMTLLGAKGKTYDELFSALHYPATFSHSQVGELITSLTAVGANDVILHIANRIFTKKDLEFLPDFVSGLQSHYFTDAKSLDFCHDPNGSRLIINKWVEEKTNSKIKDLMPDGSITSLTAAVLVNAIYFKGDWLSKFNASRTRLGDFKMSPSKTLRVNFMHARQEIGFSINRDLSFKLIHLPYKGEDLSMVVILPLRRSDGLNALEAKLNADILLKAVQTSFPVKVDLGFPKFKIEESIDLIDKLKLLGVEALFGNSADLSGITDTPLVVSKVMHKSFIEVNEEGSEAAAATAVVSVGRSGSPTYPRFTIDRPFLVGIYDKKTKIFLFWGRIAQPTSVDYGKEL